MKKKHWYDYLWIWTILYFALGFFNILFAWLGMIDFLVPLIIAIVGGNKAFCTMYRCKSKYGHSGAVFQIPHFGSSCRSG